MLDKNYQLFYNRLTWLAGIVLYATLIPGLGLNAQTAVIRANRVWCGIIEDGGTGNILYEGIWFPADYNCMGQSMERGSGMTGSNIITACTNWTDPNGNLIEKAVVRPADVAYSNWYVDSAMTNHIRWAYPTNVVDFEDVTFSEWGEVDPTRMVGTSDQTAEVTTVNAMGVQIKRKVFAWSQQFHDNYIVVDVELTNISGETLTDFYVMMRQGPYYWRKAKQYGDPGIPDPDLVDRAACWHHYYGARPGDSLRVFYMYHADEPDRNGDQMGGPVTSQDGRLVESDIAFYTILHASASPYTDPAEDVDDPLQPRITDVYDNVPMGVNWSDPLARDLIYDLIAGKNGKDQPMEGQYEGTYHRANNDEQGDPDWSNLGVGFIKGGTVFNQSISAFGPYPTFEDGQSLRFVYASGYTGIGIEKEKEIGEGWLNNNLEEPRNLPDAETGYFPSNFAYPPDATEIDKIKDRWISTGIDSVHQAASRAKWNFEHNWQIPGSPPPPTQEITGFGEGVEVKWSDPDAEILDGFAGCRVLRRVGRADTVFFDVVHQTDASDIATEHTWLDTNILFGASYFYYVQAGYRIAENDLNAYPDNRGKVIWSGRLWNPTENPVQPPRFPGEKLSDIRIVPNPYNIRDPLIADYGWDDDRGLMFFNLPPEVTIKIFTESGDLVITLVHNPPTRAGSLTWDMLTDNQQAISSGIYIAVFETPDESVAYQKFIVVR